MIELHGKVALLTKFCYKIYGIPQRLENSLLQSCNFGGMCPVPAMPYTSLSLFLSHLQPHSSMTQVFGSGQSSFPRANPIRSMVQSTLYLPMKFYLLIWFYSTTPQHTTLQPHGDLWPLTPFFSSVSNILPLSHFSPYFS